MARTLEEAGFDSLWVSDHIVLPASIDSRYPFAADGRATWPSDDAVHRRARSPSRSRPPRPSARRSAPRCSCCRCASPVDVREAGGVDRRRERRPPRARRRRRLAERGVRRARTCRSPTAGRASRSGSRSHATAGRAGRPRTRPSATRCPPDVLCLPPPHQPDPAPDGRPLARRARSCRADRRRLARAAVAARARPGRARGRRRDDARGRGRRRARPARVRGRAADRRVGRARPARSRARLPALAAAGVYEMIVDVAWDERPRRPARGPPRGSGLSARLAPARREDRRRHRRRERHRPRDRAGACRPPARAAPSSTCAAPPRSARGLDVGRGRRPRRRLGRRCDRPIERLGGIDVLVLAAGIVPPWRGAHGIRPRRVGRTSSASTCAASRRRSPTRSATCGDGAAVVAIASLNSWRGDPNIPAYAASKHAVLGIVRSAALELGRRGIRVNAIAPGPIATDALLARMARRERELGTPVPKALEAAAQRDRARADGDRRGGRARGAVPRERSLVGRDGTHGARRRRTRDDATCAAGPCC